MLLMPFLRTVIIQTDQFKRVNVSVDIVSCMAGKLKCLFRQNRMAVKYTHQPPGSRMYIEILRNGSEGQ